jgi:hypothetical protein
MELGGRAFCAFCPLIHQWVTRFRRVLKAF